MCQGMNDYALPAMYMGDEYHILFECKLLDALRKELIPVKFTNHHNTVKFQKLMNSQPTTVAKYIYRGMKLYKKAVRFH